MSDDVLFEVDRGVATATLNRPRAINALTLGMCEALLERFLAWAEDESIESVEFRGAGDRGFCAGADVRALREQILTVPELATRFFEVEYTLDALLATYPIPITSYLSGITMGGGVGLTVHSRGRRIADETTSIAMPETTIGLWPDVGATYELARCPGEIGAYLAMSGAAIDGASALYAGLVDEAVGSPEGSALASDRAWIDECFTGNDAATIIDRLQAHPDERARSTGELVRAKSPWSVCVSLEAVRRAAGMASVGEVLAQDLVLARNFVTDSDFVEGVRAQLVDKDRNPAWRHASVADVPRDLVLGVFSEGAHVRLG